MIVGSDAIFFENERREKEKRRKKLSRRQERRRGKERRTIGSDGGWRVGRRTVVRFVNRKSSSEREQTTRYRQSFIRILI